jgi:hypothetical protein
VRRFLYLLFGFALLGDVIAMIVGPHLIRFWYASPQSAGGFAALDAVKVLDYGMRSLIDCQLIGTAAGALFGAILSFVLWRRSRRLASQTTAQPAQPAAPAQPVQAAPAQK